MDIFYIITITYTTHKYKETQSTTMNGQIEISTESLERAWNNTVEYFTTLDLYQTIAWGAIGLGLILAIVGLVLL